MILSVPLWRLSLSRPREQVRLLVSLNAPVSSEVYHWGELHPKPGETDKEKKTVLSSPCRYKGDLTRDVKIVAMAAGGLHALFLADDKKLYSVGQNSYGQLGSLHIPVGGSCDQPRFVEILKDSDVRLIGCGGNHSVAIVGDAGVWTWGSNKYGQLGMPYEQAHVQFPHQVEWSLDGERVASLKCGDYHNLLLTESGSLYSWGRGSEGQLGSGETENAFVPFRIRIDQYHDSIFSRIAAGGGLGCSHSMGLTVQGIDCR